MAKKRNLKKFVQNLAENVVVNVLPHAVHAGIITEQRAHELIHEISVAQAQTLSRLSVSFDKRMREFGTKADFHKAKYAYFKQVCSQAYTEFVGKIQNILSEVNKAKKD